jgi:dipeptidyl aminopeptidase/acylaminoacyl peptidase
MTGIRAGLLAALLLAAAAPAIAAAPLDAYGRLPTIEQVAISPNGQLLALDVTKGEQRNIVIQDIASRKIVTGFQAGTVKIRDLEWAGDGHLIVLASTYAKGIVGVLADSSEWFIASDFNLATKKLTPLLGDIDYTGNMVGGTPTVRWIDGKPKLFVDGVNLSSNGGYSLFRIDLDTDRSSIVIDGGTGVQDFLVGADGHPLAETYRDAQSKEWALRLWIGGSWRQVESKTAAIETPQLRGLGRDGRSILVGAFESGVYTLREMSPSGALGDRLPGPSFGSLIHDPVSHRLLGIAALEGDILRYTFYDPDDQAQWRAIEGAFAGQTLKLASWSDDRRRLVLEVSAPGQVPGYALVDLTKGSTAWLGPEYAGLTSADVATVQPVRFKAADGLELSGYLTLPRGVDPKNLPLVVFPHGGPAARDEPGFDWWAQAMASRGYAVLQVNYRGSEGFGWKFMSAGFGEWGRKMQTDLSDGVRYLASQGTIDPKRVCIVGASYGGYAALAGVTLDPGVYRCAVDVSGPSSLPKLISWGVFREGSRQGVELERYWSRYMGATNGSDPHLLEISPADQADKASAPILIIHGKDDSVVPFEQSQIMADALKKAGKPVDFVVLNHEDHWLSRGDTRLQMLQATIDFLQKNNPPG